MSASGERARRLAGDAEMEEASRPGFPRPRLRRGSATQGRGSREALKMLVRDIPRFLKLLGRLAVDARVSRLDKALVVATIGYVLMPMDLIPDFIPVLGQMDDLFLLALSLDRLMNNAGVDVLLDHWEGHPSTLEMALSGLERAGALLPDQVRELLRRRVA
jgi:uncharacterized membrane protein YkvA (DUF1232 family)